MFFQQPQHLNMSYFRILSISKYKNKLTVTHHLHYQAIPFSSVFPNFQRPETYPAYQFSAFSLRNTTHHAAPSDTPYTSDSDRYYTSPSSPPSSDQQAYTSDSPSSDIDTPDYN